MGGGAGQRVCRTVAGGVGEGVSGGRQSWRARPFPFASTCMLLTIDMLVWRCEIQKGLLPSAQMHNGDPLSAAGAPVL